MTEKLDRHTLKGPDEFTIAVRRVTTWAAAHRRWLTAGGVAVVLVLAIGSVVSWNRARSQQQAVEQFRRAHAAFQAQRWADAARDFGDLVRDHGGSSFGRVAILYQAHALRAADDAAAATAAYERFLATRGLAPEYRQQALLALAQIREDAGSAADALDAYQQATALEGPYTLDAEFGAARLQAQLGHRAEAAETYERILPQASADLKPLVEARLAAIRDDG